jgi:lysozyme family protein
VSFEEALAKTLNFEGGYSNNRLDPGGRTNYGVTQRTYDAYRTTTGQAKQDVALIGDEEVRAIYLQDYWNPCNCDELPEKLAFAVFDMAVNSGVWNAKLALQRAAKVQQDGVIGPQTIAAVQEPDIVIAFLRQRAALVAEILVERPSQVVFAHGWIVRLLEQAWSLK